MDLIQLLYLVLCILILLVIIICYISIRKNPYNSGIMIGILVVLPILLIMMIFIWRFNYADETSGRKQSASALSESHVSTSDDNSSKSKEDIKDASAASTDVSSSAADQDTVVIDAIPDSKKSAESSVNTQTIGQSGNEVSGTEGQTSEVAANTEAGETSGGTAEQNQESADTEISYIALPYGGTAPASDFYCPGSSTNYLSYDEVDAWVKQMSGGDTSRYHFYSQMIINEIFCRYGYYFSSDSETAAECRNRYGSKDWYINAQPYCPDCSTDDMIKYYMNDYERYNILEVVNVWQANNNAE